MSETLRYAGLVFAFIGLTGAVCGCTSDKQKVRKLLEGKLKTCQKQTDQQPFYKMPLYNGDEKTEVLSSVCSESVSKLERKDDYSFRAEVGPYTWHLGLNTDLGVWNLEDVEWNTLAEARRRLAHRDLEPDDKKEIGQILSDAQSQYPASEWIRLKRLEMLLEYRSADRSIDEKEPLSLGDSVNSYLSDLKAWAQKNDKTNVANEAEYMVADHLYEAKSWVDNFVNPSTRRDEWLQQSIKKAKEDDNPKKAEQYEKELEKTREKRKKRKKIAEKLVEPLNKKVCEQVNELEADDKTLDKRISSLKGRVSCE